MGANTGAHTYFGKFFQLSAQFICGGENNTYLTDTLFLGKMRIPELYLACSNSFVTVEVFLMFTAVWREKGGAGVGGGEDELIN